jgi:hypothetical protein
MNDYYSGPPPFEKWLFRVACVLALAVGGLLGAAIATALVTY